MSQQPRETFQRDDQRRDNRRPDNRGRSDYRDDRRDSRQDDQRRDNRRPDNRGRSDYRDDSRDSRQDSRRGGDSQQSDPDVLVVLVTEDNNSDNDDRRRSNDDRRRPNENRRSRSDRDDDRQLQRDDGRQGQRNDGRQGQRNDGRQGQRDDRGRQRDQRRDGRNQEQPPDIIFVVAGPVDTGPAYGHTHGAHGWGGHGHGCDSHGHGWGGHGHGGWGGHGGHGHGHGGGYWNVKTPSADENFREVVRETVFDKKQFNDSLGEDYLDKWLSLALSPNVYTNDSTAICSSILMEIFDTLPVLQPSPTVIGEMSTTTHESRRTTVESVSESVPGDDGIRVIFPSGNISPSPEPAESTFIFEQLADCNPLFGKTALTSSIAESPSTFMLDSHHAAGEGNNGDVIQDSQLISGKPGADKPSEPVIVCAKKSQTTVRGSLDEEYHPYSKLKAPPSQESGSVVEGKTGYLAISEKMSDEIPENYLIPTPTSFYNQDETSNRPEGYSEANNVCNFIFRHLIGTLPLIEEKSSDNIPIEPNRIVSSHFASSVDRGTLSEKHVLSRPSDADKVCTNIVGDLVSAITEDEIGPSIALSDASIHRSVKRQVVNEDETVCPLEQKSFNKGQIPHDYQNPQGLQGTAEFSGSECRTNTQAFDNLNERTSFITYTAMQETHRGYGKSEDNKCSAGYTPSYRYGRPRNVPKEPDMTGNTIPDLDHNLLVKENLLGLKSESGRLDIQDMLFADSYNNQYTDEQKFKENGESSQESHAQDQFENPSSVLDFLEIGQYTSRNDCHNEPENIDGEQMSSPLELMNPFVCDENDNYLSPDGGTVQHNLETCAPFEQQDIQVTVESSSVCSGIANNIVTNLPEHTSFNEDGMCRTPFVSTIEKISEETSLEFSPTSTSKTMNAPLTIHFNSGRSPKPDVIKETTHEHLPFHPEDKSNAVSVANSEMIQQNVEYTDKLDVLVENLSLLTAKTAIPEEQGSASNKHSGSEAPSRKPRSCAMINKNFIRRRKRRKSTEGKSGGSSVSASEDSDGGSCIWEDPIGITFGNARKSADSRSPGLSHGVPTHRRRATETIPCAPNVTVSINVSVPGGPMYAQPTVNLPMTSQLDGPTPISRPPTGRKPPENT